MEVAEQNPVVDVCSARRMIVRNPLVRVVCLAERGWPIAVGPDAPTIPGRERPVLRRGEEPLRLAVVEHLAPTAEDGGSDGEAAAQLRDGLRGNRLVNAVDPSDAMPGFEVLD
jgi:hypothetical protein